MKPDDISGMSGVEFLEGNSAQELLGQLRQINLPTSIISIYSQGSKHYAWIRTQAKIKKIIKTKEITNVD